MDKYKYNSNTRIFLPAFFQSFLTMSYFDSDPKYARLVVLNTERDNLLAEIADEELKNNSATYGKERIVQRLSRRAWGRSIGRQHSIPPVPWGYDLDMYHGKEYSVALDGGYTAILRRGGQGYAWNGYVQLSAGHCCIGKPYAFFSYELPEGVPCPPMELTWAVQAILAV